MILISTFVILIQYKKLVMSFLLQPQTPVPNRNPAPHVNTLPANFQNLLDIASTSPFHSSLNEWIIDLRATDHVVSLIEMFVLCRPVTDIFVKLPNSVTILITFVGDVYILPMLTSYNTFYTPNFALNFIA